AHRANRFAAARGQQIRGLCFEGFQLDGINVAPVDSHSHGLISEIDGSVGSGVDRVEFVLRDGHREVYGSRHGADRDHGGRRGADGDPSSHKLHNEEYLLAVSQEHS
ncbi:unnamed protein product, partial [Polarella glacialis]